VTIHSEHPFRDASSDPVRQLRGRLGGAVTLWTSRGADSDRPAGLTVSSVMVANGALPHVVALVDPDSDLADALTTSGRAVVQLLSWRHRDLAEVFAETAPAPGGKFAQAEFHDTDWGPRLVDADTWAGVSLTDARELGWSTLVTCRVEHVEVGESGPEDAPLVHRRGRYEPPRQG
jgi:flavin reductase (DIM6/NTAB) family NADH-FMN oxidoreductase RutF